MPKEYEVGYGRPPQRTRFHKGKSGNPKGRPKGRKNVATIFHEITEERIQITESGKVRSITKFEAILLQITNKAASGDVKAAKEVLQWRRIFETSMEESLIEDPGKDTDRAVIARLLKRVQKTNLERKESE